jgi:phosphatidylserine/phosphatidylglycerophosphate/cardiolipin synthase-like enzyme
MAVRLIDSARSRVLVAAYSLKNRWVAEALIRAHRRGVEVKAEARRVNGFINPRRI